MNYFLGQKKSLFSGNQPGENSLTRPHSRIYIRIYIFNFKKQTNKQQNKKTKKAKETKEGKRITTEKNRLVKNRFASTNSLKNYYLASKIYYQNHTHLVWLLKRS